MKSTTFSASGAALWAGALLTFNVAGCGGGAGSEVTITMKSSEVDQPSGDGGPGSTPANGGAPAGGGQPGKVVGRVLFEGTPPQLAPVVALANIKREERNVCTPETVGNDTLMVNGQNGGVANVFVYLDRVPRGATAPDQELSPVQFDNKNCRFVPHGLFVQVGQTVNVTNSDPFAHNTQVLKVGFNSTIQANAPPTPLTYPRAESIPVNVACSYHTWMTAYHLVLDHPWGAATDENGRFELPELPGGDYQLRIWHEKAGFLDRGYKVTVDGNKYETEPLEIRFGADKFASFNGPQPKTVLIAGR